MGGPERRGTLEEIWDEVVITNHEKFEGKMQRLKGCGIDTLHGVFDYDRTLTPDIRIFAGNGAGAENTAFGLLRHDSFVVTEQIESAQAAFDHFRPIEKDTDLGLVEKMQNMQEWSDSDMADLKEFAVTRTKLKDVGRMLVGRPGLRRFMQTLHKNNVPVLVFSGGLGDSIKEFFDYNDMRPDSVHIIANFCEFDDEGRVIGWAKDKTHINPFTKNEQNAEPYLKRGIIAERKNLILLGDQPSDTAMATGPRHDTVLTIGFLNNREDQLKEYQKEFDVLIKGSNASLDFVTSVVRQIAAASIGRKR